MEHFIDVLLNRKFDLKEEVLAIEKLIRKQSYNTSIMQDFSSKFLNWKFRRNFVEMSTFLKSTGIIAIVEKCNNGYAVTLEEFLYYCEYALNLLPGAGYYAQDFVRCVRENINNILEGLNYTIHQENGYFHIIQKDVLISETADVVKDDYDLGESIFSFNYRENSGDLNKKSDILCRLYKYIESIASKCKQYGYSTMLDDIKDLMNKLNIRHNATSKQIEVIQYMKESEYESWVDDLFRRTLSLILLVDYTEKRKDIKELKARLG